MRLAHNLREVVRERLFVTEVTFDPVFLPTNGKREVRVPGDDVHRVLIRDAELENYWRMRHPLGRKVPAQVLGDGV